MARSTYSKLEAGVTAMPVDTLVRIAAILRVSAYDLIQEDGQSYVALLDDKFSVMLNLAEHALGWEDLKAVPYEELTFPQLAFLSGKGLTSREDYESTPLGGRFYEYGPQDVFAYMMMHLGMSVLFEEKLVRDPHWLARWKTCQEARQGTEPELAASLDEHDYFIVYIINLIMPNGATRLVQMAERDFPAGLDAEGALTRLIAREGAASGDILAVTEEGFDPVSEIVKIN